MASAFCCSLNQSTIHSLHSTSIFGDITLTWIFLSSNILIVSRLNGLLEFIELGNRLREPQIESSTFSKPHHVPLSMKKKVHSNLPCWQVITNGVHNDVYPCYSCRAHRKTISVLATSKDLLISGSYDNLLKVVMLIIIVLIRFRSKAVN